MLRRLAVLGLLAALATNLYAQVPVVSAKKRTGTITIDGNVNESLWQFNNTITKPIIGTTNNTAKFAVLWDSLYLYVAFTVTDASRFNESANAWDDDAVEVYIDADNNGGTSYGTNDRQFVKEWNGSTIWEKGGKTTGVTHAWANTATGYSVELRIPWSNIGIINPAIGFTIGFDAASDDDDNGAARESQVMWSGDNDNWQYTRNFGDLVLVSSDTQAPTAPANLTSSGLTQASVNLSWTASTDNVGVMGYDVYRNGTKINAANITATTFAATGLSASTAYQFYVRAKDAVGNTSANSNTITITTPDTQAPDAPGNISVTNLSPNSFTITWNASTDNVGVTGYDVFIGGIKINTALIAGTTFNATGLTASTAYPVYVVAHDAANNTTNSSTVNVTTPAPPDTAPPSAPGGLTATNSTQNATTLTWTAASDNLAVTGYDVYRNGIKITASPVTATTYNATGLSAATTYSFYVIARDAAGNVSAASNTTEITTPDTQAPASPGKLAVSNLSQTSLTLHWTAATDNVAVTGYELSQDNVLIATLSGTTVSYNITGLTENTSYAYSIQALDGAGNHSATAVFSITTLPPPDVEAPSAPTGLIVTNLTQASASIAWTASADNIAVTGYDVYINGTKVNSSLLATTSFTTNNLLASTTYNIVVIARDAADNQSENSETLVLTTPDTQAPAAPGSLSFSNLTAGSVTLSWMAATDNVGVAGYDVFQNGIKFNNSPITDLNYAVTGLTQATTYTFLVKALDAAGNISAPSNNLTVTTPDTQSPSAPASLASSNLTATSVTLTWTAATDNIGVTGYDVYRNGSKINTSIVAATTYADTALSSGTAYSFYVIARDAAGNLSTASNTISLTTTAPAGCSGTGAIRYQKWTNITGTAVANLTSVSTYPNSPNTAGTLTSFEIPANAGDNYGMKVYGYICPPTTGSYTFWIASDDNAELWLSTNASPASKVKIASQAQWTNAREWNKYATQKSAAITLTTGQLYYVEALMKEGSQGDHMAVGWSKPGQSTATPSEVIPGSQLVAQIADTQAPSAPANLSANAITQTSLSLNWSASTDNIGVAGYDVYRNGTKINTSTITSIPYNVTGLTPATSYSFTVIAKDAAGNASAASMAYTATTLLPNPGFETFTQRTVIANQRMPHDLVYGPDNNIWYTERFGGKVSYVNPATGVKTVVLTLGSKMVLVGGQDGLMGLALHPQFLSGKPFVYISYTYQSTSATVRKTRIERYTYDFTTKTLAQPVTILENIPGSNDHNSARIAIGPDLKLYYSVGDMGAGQFDNLTRTENAQNLNVLEGKILRLNTEAIAGSWIPTDNPFTNAGVKTPVYTFGHRNPQGLVWGNVNGASILYSSEHGPYSDDEINIIEAGRNYGWPQVAGFCDGNYNGRTIGTFAVVSEQNNCITLNVKEPIRSLFPAANPPAEGTDNLTWPSTGPSGTDFYSGNAIPGWQNSLLVAQLKNSTLTRLKLSNDGLSIISDTIHYFRGKGRFRDVVVSPDGLKIYIACDSSGSTSGPTGGVTGIPPNPGSILEFTYQSPAGARAVNQLVMKTMGLEEMKTGELEVYPNPASVFTVIYNYKSIQGLQAELVDLNGKVLRKQLLTNVATKLSVSGLASGMYLVKIVDAKGKVVRVEKIVVQK
jgi:PQQ-dependent dehydrogenase (s-GDH family)